MKHLDSFKVAIEELLSAVRSDAFTLGKLLLLRTKLLRILLFLYPFGKVRDRSLERCKTCGQARNE